MPSEASLPNTSVFTLDVGPRNILDLAVVDALADAIAPDPDRPVLILRGRLDGFCSGLDGRLLAAGPPESDRLLARERLDRRREHALTAPGEIVKPAEARNVGFIDEVVEPDRLQAVIDGAANALSPLSERAYPTSARSALPTET